MPESRALALKIFKKPPHFVPIKKKVSRSGLYTPVRPRTDTLSQMQRYIIASSLCTHNYTGKAWHTKQSAQVSLCARIHLGPKGRLAGRPHVHTPTSARVHLKLSKYVPNFKTQPISIFANCTRSEAAIYKNRKCGRRHSLAARAKFPKISAGATSS